MHTEHIEKMPMVLAGNWSELKTRGYLIVRNFLSPDELRAQLEFYETAPRSSTKEVYLKAASDSALNAINAKLQPHLQSINNEAGIVVNRISKGVYVLTEKEALDWHADHESYYIQQCHKNYITIWIPLVKPDSKRSGLSIIPMDRLAASEPAVFKTALNGGAARYLEDRAEFERGRRRVSIPVSSTPSSLAVSPEMFPGDALVFRMDAFHCTQDSETNRVAIAVRVINGDQMIEKSKLFTMSERKFRRILAERFNFSCVLGAFWHARSSRISLNQLFDFRKRVEQNNLLEVLTTVMAYIALPVIARVHYFLQPKEGDSA